MNKNKRNILIFFAALAILALNLMIAVPFSLNKITDTEFILKYVVSGIIMFIVAVLVNFYKGRLLEGKEKNCVLFVLILCSALAVGFIVNTVIILFKTVILYSDTIRYIVIFAHVFALLLLIYMIKELYANLTTFSERTISFFVYALIAIEMLAFLGGLFINIRALSYNGEFIESDITVLTPLVFGIPLSILVLYKLYVAAPFEISLKPLFERLAQLKKDHPVKEPKLKKEPVIEYPPIIFDNIQYSKICPDINGIVAAVCKFVNRAEFNVENPSEETYKFFIHGKEFLRIKTGKKEYKVNFYAPMEEMQAKLYSYSGRIVFASEKVSSYGVHLAQFKASYQNDFFFDFEALQEIMKLSYDTFLSYEAQNAYLKAHPAPQEAQA